MANLSLGNSKDVHEIPDMDEIPDMEEDLEAEDEATAAPVKAPATAAVDAR